MGSLAKVAVAYVVAVVIGYLLSHAYTEYQFNKIDQSSKIQELYEKTLPYKSQLTDLESKLQTLPNLKLCERLARYETVEDNFEPSSRRGEVVDPRFKYLHDSVLERVLDENQYLQLSGYKPDENPTYQQISLLFDCVIRYPESERCFSKLLEILKAAILDIKALKLYGNVIVHNLVAHDKFPSNMIPSLSNSLTTCQRYKEVLGLVDHAISRSYVDKISDSTILELYKIDALSCLAYFTDDWMPKMEYVFDQLAANWRDYQRAIIPLKNHYIWSQLPKSSTNDFWVTKALDRKGDFQVIHLNYTVLIQPQQWLRFPDRDVYLVEIDNGIIDAQNFIRTKNSIITQSYHRLFAGLQSLHSQAIPIYSFEEKAAIHLGGWMPQHPISILSMVSRLILLHQFVPESVILIEQDSPIFRGFLPFFNLRSDQVYAIPKYTSFVLPRTRMVVWEDIPELPASLIHQYIVPGAILQLTQKYLQNTFSQGEIPPLSSKVQVTLMVSSDDEASWLKTIMAFADDVRVIDERTNPALIPGYIINSHLIVVHRSNLAAYLIFARTGANVLYLTDPCIGNQAFMGSLAAALEWNYYTHPDFRGAITEVSDAVKKILKAYD